MQVPVKDEGRQIPVPDLWRPIITTIVYSLTRGDVLNEHLSVEPVTAEFREQCARAVAAYGDVTLIPLPAEAWETSVALWMGDRWRCLVDLWTAQGGRSDLVLELDVFELSSGYRFSVHLVYSP
jgi:hypothetical protein